MKNAVKSVLGDIRSGSNLDIYLSALVGLVVAVLGLVGAVSFEILGAAILLVLSVLAGSLLLTRRQASESASNSATIADHLSHIQESLSPALDLEFEYPELTPLLTNATSIDILGASLASADRYRGAFEEALDKGASVRLLVSEPTDEVAKATAYRSYSDPGEDPSVVLESLARRMNKLATMGSTATRPDQFGLRTIGYMAPFGLALLTDPSGVTKVYVKLLPFRVPNGRYPVIAMDSERNPRWSEYFRDRFESMWLAATEYSSGS